MASIFNANDFVKKNCFFVSIDFINDIKIYRAIVAFSKVSLIENLEEKQSFI